MAYIKRTVRAGPVTFVDKYYSARYGKRNIPRGININESTDEQKHINEKNKRERMMWVMCANFKKGDWWVTLNYRKGERPDNIDDGHNKLRIMIKKLHRKLKREDIEIYYMGMTERGSKGGIHHHMVIRKSFDISRLIELWEYGKVIVDDCYTDNLAELSSYFVKGDSEVSEKRYTKSRNLHIPVPKKEIIRAEHWRENPRPTKTHDILNVFDGYHETTGYKYQSYIMVRRC